MSFAAALADHLARGEVGTATAGFTALLSADMDLGEVLRSQLAGKVFSLDGQGTVEFPAGLRVDLHPKTRSASFTPPAVVRMSRGPLRVSANISGVTIDLDSLTIRIDRFPDFTVRLLWRAAG